MSRLYDRIVRYGTVSTASDGNEPEPWDSAADLRRPIDEPEMV